MWAAKMGPHGHVSATTASAGRVLFYDGKKTNCIFWFLFRKFEKFAMYMGVLDDDCNAICSDLFTPRHAPHEDFQFTSTFIAHMTNCEVNQHLTAYRYNGSGQLMVQLRVNNNRQRFSSDD
jgi:hypothetical protein